MLRLGLVPETLPLTVWGGVVFCHVVVGPWVVTG